jgi:translation initiation factor IF-2
VQPDAADAAEAPTPPPDVEAFDAVEVEPAELAPRDAAAGDVARSDADAPNADPSPVPLAPGELTERPELEVEPEPEPDREAADPSAPTRDVEADGPAASEAVAADAPAPGSAVDAEAPPPAIGDEDGAGDTRPLEPVDEAAPETSGAVDGAGTEDLRVQREGSPEADDAELDPSPWSDRDTTAGLELDPAPAEPQTAPAGAALAEAASTDDVRADDVRADDVPADDVPAQSPVSNAEPAVAGGPDDAGLGARLERFLAGPNDPARVEWWTRMVLEILRDADLLTDERLERAAARLADSAEPPAP